MKEFFKRLVCRHSWIIFRKVYKDDIVVCCKCEKPLKLKINHAN
jgi:hypothetical protein